MTLWHRSRGLPLPSESPKKALCPACSPPWPAVLPAPSRAWPAVAWRPALPFSFDLPAPERSAGVVGRRPRSGDPLTDRARVFLEARHPT